MNSTGSRLTLNGISGMEYIFDLYTFDDFSELRSAFLARAGVYLFTRRRATNEGFTHDLVYLGETENLAKRFDNHHKEAKIKAHHANCIGIHAAPADEEQRKLIESDMLAAYDFPCNEQLNK